LHRNRLIEPVLLADLFDDGGIAFLAGHHQRGSPGNRCCSEKIRIDTKNSVGSLRQALG